MNTFNQINNKSTEELVQSIGKWVSCQGGCKSHYFLSLRKNNGNYIICKCTGSTFHKISKGYLWTLEHEEVMKIIFGILYKQYLTFNTFEELYEFLYPSYYYDEKTQKVTKKSVRNYKQPIMH